MTSSSSPSVNPFEIQPHDLALLTIAPQNQTDPRVPLAEGFAAWAKMMLALHKQTHETVVGGYGWNRPPNISITGNRTISISGVGRLPSCRGEINIDNATIEIPPLPNTSSTIMQEDGIFLLGFVCEVGAEQDNVLGQVSFQYRDPETEQIVTIAKENEQRFRSFWAIFRGEKNFDIDLFKLGFADSVDGKKILNVANVLASGFRFAEGNLYALDPHWVAKSYAVLPDLITYLPICTISRKQNITDRGYTSGFNGEEPMAKDYTIAKFPSKFNITSTQQSRIESRIQEIISGKPGPGITYARTVQNLTAGVATGVPGVPGESSGAPNGSVNLANGQRISFTNQSIRSNLAVVAQAAGNDGGGNAVCNFTLGNAPTGTRFSERASDHKIFNAQGEDVSARGRWANLGLSGTLIWTAEDNPGITPGAIAYFQATIIYPSGSGFSFPFQEVERCWLNSQEIPLADIRTAENDLDKYEEPNGSASKILVFGPERAALHYIYSKVSVVTGNSGVAAIPSSERGCFAFIQGVEGRLDTPTVTGLQPNQTYNALIYHPPRTNEVWQVQFKYCPYQGLRGIPSGITQMTIAAPPVGIVHSQGGGASAFFGGNFRFVPVSMNLPASNQGVQPFTLNTSVEFAGERYNEPISMRSIIPVASRRASPGQVGERITFSASPVPATRGASIVVKSENHLLGCQMSPLSSGLPYQFVLIIPVIDDNQNEYLLIATRVGIGGNIVLDPQFDTAIDFFRI